MNYFSLQNPESYFCIWFQDKNVHLFKSASELAKMDFTGRENIFFTPNSLGFRNVNGRRNIWRDRNYLQILESLYCDIDLQPEESPEQVYQYIKEHMIGSELPLPSTVVCSGNGLHLYWSIESLPYKGNLDKWKQAQEYIYRCLCHLGADHAVTCDTVRVLRVPGTINNKHGIRKNVYTIEENWLKYDLDEFISEYVTTDLIEKKKTKNRKHNNHVWSFFLKTFRDRLSDLGTLLIDYRDNVQSQKDKKPGRECILFLYRYYALEVTHDREKALKMTLELNSRLNNPLTVDEVKKRTITAEGYYFGKKLKWTNAKLIEWLMITEEEQKSLSVLCVRNRSKENRNYYEKKLRKSGKNTKQDQIVERQIKIYEMLKKGYNKVQICLRLGISERTFYSDLKQVKNEVFIAAYKRMKKILKTAKNGTSDCTDSCYCNFFSVLNYNNSVDSAPSYTETGPPS